MAAAVLKEETINLRIRKQEKTLIDHAAEATGKKRTEFVIEAAREKAEKVLLDQAVFILDADRYQRFMELLDAPVVANPGLERLLAAKAPWTQ